MAYLNANIPVTYAQIRREYLYDLKKHHGEVEDCVIFGISSITGKSILFHAIMENGAIFYRLPISAFIQRGYEPKEVPQRRLDELQLWNCFSYYPAVTSWDILDGQAGKYIGKDKKWHAGKYLFTVDFAHPESNIVDTDHSEIPHEHKCAHILALDDGNYAAQPNNRIIWDIPSFTVKDNVPDWKVQTSEWNVEDSRAWRTEDTDKFFYEIEEKKKMKIFCFDCGHRCHCLGQGYFVSTSQCASCDCVVCNHTNIKNIGENMLKRIWKKIKSWIGLV